MEQIALMKPKAQSEHDEGMLEFLEDIIGTSRFKEPIEELAKRVEELNEARGEKVWMSLRNEFLLSFKAQMCTCCECKMF